MASPTRRHASVYAFVSNAFMGLPWPKKIACRISAIVARPCDGTVSVARRQAQLRQAFVVTNIYALLQPRCSSPAPFLGLELTLPACEPACANQECPVG